MKKVIQSILKTGMIAAALMGLVGSTALVPASVAYASNADKVQAGVNEIGGDQPGNGEQALPIIIRKIVNILLFIIGVIAVIMIIIGGLKYVTSSGDQAQVTSAKNTILYAIVGLVVAIMSYALVNFIVSKF